MRTALAALFLAVVLPGAGELFAKKKEKALFFKDRDASWTTEKGGYARTASLEDSVSVPLEVVWKKNVGRSIGATPSAADEYIFVGTQDRHLLTLNRSTGETIWNKVFKGGFGGTALIYQGKLYFNTQAPEGKAFALDINFKHKDIQRQIGPVKAAPIIGQNQLFLFPQSGKLLALNPEVGFRNWERQLEGKVEYAPVYIHPYLYVAVLRGAIYKLVAETGEIQVQREYKDGLLLGDLSSDGAHIFAVLSRGQVYCLEPDSLNQVWETDLGQLFYAGPSVADNSLFLASRNGFLFRLNLSDGSLVWKAKLDGVAVCTPSLAGDLVFTGTKSGAMEAFDRNTGERLWYRKIEEGISASPLIFKDYVYYCTDRGTVYAFHSK